MIPLLRVDDIHKTYKIGTVEIRALQGVSVTIHEGEFVAIMGPSGSGKSTLMHLLGFLDTPDRGKIFLSQHDVSDLSDAHYAFLRNHVIGFVFQQFNLLPRATALENATLPLLYSGPNADESVIPRQVLTQVGLENRVQHKPNELSGGQQQRVAIARALVNNPCLILADEPTGNLDSHSGSEIMGIFDSLHQKGMTIVMVTHDDSIARRAGRIIRMHDGRVVSDETVRPNPVRAESDIKISLDFEKRKLFNLQEIRDDITQAVRMILSNKLRSFLSMLGVLIGVACVIAMLALGQGARESIKEQLSRLGSNLLSIRPGSTKVHGVALEAGSVTRFTTEDAQAIKEGIPEVKRIAPQVQGSAQLVYGDANWRTVVIGVTPEYAPMKNQEPVMGRFFSDDEDKMRRRVALVGQTVIRELFGGENPVGKTMKLNRVSFQVIGVLPSIGGGGFRDQDDVVLIPLMTAMKRVLGKQYLDQIDVEISSLEAMPQAEEQIRSMITRRHRLRPENEDTFNVHNFASLQQALTGTTRTFTILLGSVAAISLIVGGIGIMNIMLVSIKERTREIGLRKAVGATFTDILMQFLVEAVVITFVGGLCGILLAAFVSWVITVLAGWKTVITFSSLFLAFFFSAGIGIVFGIWPAKQAAELEPIQALRYE